MSNKCLSVARFTAPELLTNSFKVSEKVDVFSFGAFAFFVITGGEYARVSIEEIKSSSEISFPSFVKEEAQELIKACMSVNPSDRPSFCEIVDYIYDKKFDLIEGVSEEIEEIKEFLSASK